MYCFSWPLSIRTHHFTIRYTTHTYCISPPSPTQASGKTRLVPVLLRLLVYNLALNTQIVHHFPSPSQAKVQRPCLTRIPSQPIKFSCANIYPCLMPLYQHYYWRTAGFPKLSEISASLISQTGIVIHQIAQIFHSALLLCTGVRRMRSDPVQIHPGDVLSKPSPYRKTNA